MDAIGLLLSATLVATVLVVFELVVRVVCDAVDDVRYSVAPAVLGGLRAWADDRDTTRPPVLRPADTDDAPPPGGPTPEAPANRPRDSGLVVPVTRVTRGRSSCLAT